MNKESKLNYYTYTLNMTILNILAIILFILVGGLVLFIERHDNYTVTLPMTIFFILMFVWLIIHEILHGIAFFIFKEVKKENITFGMFLEKGVFYCMCKQNIGKKVILTSLLFPITIIGFITLIIGMIINNYELVFLSVLNIVSSIGDIVMTIYFLRCPKDIIYLDLDDCTSFTVLSNKSLDDIKVPGIVLAKKGTYDKKKMKAKDKRRIVISKLSYILLIIILILIIISIIRIN
ncbi:MAG: DUF3267 domain-containing protein [Bacilli bacterium]|nr:DUF3267 domain-containing protein [Bacilli bacterium]